MHPLACESTLVKPQQPPSAIQKTLLMDSADCLIHRPIITALSWIYIVMLGAMVFLACWVYHFSVRN